MKNQWPVWLFVVGVVGVVLFAFNYQSQEQLSSVKEMFPDKEPDEMADFEYEFVDESADKETPAAVDGQQTQTPEAQVKQTPSTTTATMAQKTPGGTAPAIATATSPTIGSTSGMGKQPYTIQVSSFRDRQQAERALQDIKKVGHPAYITSKDLKDKGVWHRIYVGSFQTKKDADDYLSNLKKDYKNSFIVSLQN
jgi:cell division septation protein DedD